VTGASRPPGFAVFRVSALHLDPNSSQRKRLLHEDIWYITINMASRLPAPKSAFLHKARDSMFPPPMASSKVDPDSAIVSPFLADCITAMEQCGKHVCDI
jgi:hypothetical protein